MSRAVFPAAAFARDGLNRQAIFDLSALPADIVAALGPTSADDRQLILLGHAGRRLWDCVQAVGGDSADPIDDYTVRCIAQHFAAHLPGSRYRILYPGPRPLGLQRLGALAGWHHATPFKVGIDAAWGSWFAYRAVVLAASDFRPSAPVDRDNGSSSHPCDACAEKTCIAHCPADALAGGSLLLAKCLAYRRQPQSACQFTCLARVACPVGSEHRYSDAQLHHTYARSLALIREAY